MGTRPGVFCANMCASRIFMHLRFEAIRLKLMNFGKHCWFFASSRPRSTKFSCIRKVNNKEKHTPEERRGICCTENANNHRQIGNTHNKSSLFVVTMMAQRCCTHTFNDYSISRFVHFYDVDCYMMCILCILCICQQCHWMLMKEKCETNKERVIVVNLAFEFVIIIVTSAHEEAGTCHCYLDLSQQ